MAHIVHYLLQEILLPRLSATLYAHLLILFFHSDHHFTIGWRDAVFFTWLSVYLVTLPWRVILRTYISLRNIIHKSTVIALGRVLILISTLEFVVRIRSCVLELIIFIQIFSFLLKGLGGALQAVRVVRLPSGWRAGWAAYFTFTIHVIHRLLCNLLSLIFVLLLLEVCTANTSIICSWRRCQYRWRLLVMVLRVLIRAC